MRLNKMTEEYEPTEHLKLLLNEVKIELEKIAEEEGYDLEYVTFYRYFAVLTLAKSITESKRLSIRL